MDLQITPKKLSGVVTPPSSKSQAHRLLIAAALSLSLIHISSLAEDHILIAAGHDVLGAHQPLLVGGGHAPFDHDGFVLMAYGLE